MSYTDQINKATNSYQVFQIFNQATCQTKKKIGGKFFGAVIKRLSQANDPQNIERSKKVYNEMRRRGITGRTHNFNDLLFTCAKAHNLDHFKFYFNNMQKVGIQGDLKTCNISLMMFTNIGLFEEAIGILKEMEKDGEWDKHTQARYNQLIKKCVENGRDDLALQLYEMSSKGKLKPTVRSCNQIINIYAEKENTQKAHSVFQNMIKSGLRPDRITYNTLIKCSIKTDDHQWTHGLYETMKAKGIGADEVTHKLCWKRVQKIRRKATDTDLREECKTFYETCRKTDAVFQKFSRSPNREIQALRQAGSTTINRDQIAKLQWNATDLKVREMARKRLPLTKERICAIHGSLGGTGSFRQEGMEVSAGGNRDLVYAPSSEVEKEMTYFVNWLDKELKGCDEGRINPIETAARAFQRLVTVHPFPDQNGRTTRMIMDYVLQRYSILPAAIGTDVCVANFAFTPNGKTPTTATQAVLKAVKKSYEIMGS